MLAIRICTSRLVGGILRSVVTLTTIPNVGLRNAVSVIPARRRLDAMIGYNIFERFRGATARSVLAFKDQLGIYYHG